ncbi:MAG: hypothetical protein WDZ41_04330 [Candidatus Babeliales bacterium]
MHIPKLLLLILLVLQISTTAHALDAIALKSFKDEWQFLDYMLLEKPTQEFYSLKNKSIGLISTFMGFELGKNISGLLVSNRLANLNAEEVYQSNEENLTLVFLYETIKNIIGSMSLFITYKGYKYISKHWIQFNALKNFIENWSTYKKYTPQEFHESFDMLSRLYSNKETYSKFKSITYELIPIIEQTLKHHFPKKYTPVTKTPLIPWILE